eukprot:s2974_g14.t1
MEPEKKEDEENENKGEKEKEENEGKEEEQQPLEKTASKVLKKPASKAKAKAGSKPKDESVDPDGRNEKRSKDAGGKFKKLLKAGKLPAQIKEIWENVKPEERRKTPRQAAGKCRQTIPASEAGRRLLTKAMAKMPRPLSHAIMLHHYFHGDADAFNQALASGDITEVNQGGKACQTLHADALRKSYGRQRALNLELHRYAEPDQAWGRMPVVVISGDELQLPPVPFAHSLLASTDGTSDEHKAGVHLIVWPVSVRVPSADCHALQRSGVGIDFEENAHPAGRLVTDAEKRAPNLTPAEWKAFMATNITGSVDAGCLAGTEHFFQACYTHRAQF